MKLQVYADESGVQESPPYCIFAGFMADSHTWQHFRFNWQEILAKQCIDEFKSSIFFGRRYASDKSRNPFRNWSDDKALKFLIALVNVIKQHKLTYLRRAVDVKAFFQFGKTQRQVLTWAVVSKSGKIVTSGSPNKPYHFAFGSLIDEALRHAQHGDEVEFILDENHVEAEYAKSTYLRFQHIVSERSRKKMGELCFQASDKEPGIQAADLYAHLWYRALTHRTQNSISKMDDERTIAKVLLDGEYSEIGIWQFQDMRKHLQHWLTPAQLEGLSRRYDNQ